MTVLEAIQKSAEFLAKKGVESPRLQTELLLAHLLKLPRMKLYLNFERALTPAETDALRELVKRRGQREPLQHIIGSTSFCGLEIAVNRHVLVPRPETELLAESGWEFLNQLSEGEFTTQLKMTTGTRTRPPALDFGTGTRLHRHRAGGEMPGGENHRRQTFPRKRWRWPKKTRRETTSRSGLNFCKVMGLRRCKIGGADVSRFRKRDMSAHARRLPRQFDLIISNPPYIPSAEIATLQPEVRDFDPRGALDGGADGLDFYRRLAAEAAAFLKPGGRVMLEFGDGQAGRDPADF